MKKCIVGTLIGIGIVATIQYTLTKKEVTVAPPVNTDTTTLSFEKDVWVWKTTTIGNTTIEPNKVSGFELTFDKAKHTVHAKTDCNNVFGRYALGEHNALSLSELGMTRMFCPNSQEAPFVEGLAKVRTYKIDDLGQLVFTLASTTDTMIFTRQNNH